MAESDAKVNMSLDDIIKLGRKDKKKRPAAAVAGKGGAKRNVPVKGNRQQGNSLRQRSSSNVRGKAGANKNGKIINQQSKKSQAWRLQRNQNNGGFVAKKYKQNGGLKRTQSKTNLNLKKTANQPQQATSKIAFIPRRAARGGKVAALTRSRSRNNLAPTQGLKRYLTTTKGLKRTSSMPNLRDPTSVHNRLGYQSPAQVAYRNRVKRAKQLLLQRQSQRVASTDFVAPRPAKTLPPHQHRGLDRRQQILTPQRPFNNGGFRSDQIVRAQRRAQYNQKITRINAARVNPNPNVNFMCTLGDSFTPGSRQRSMNQNVSSRNSRPYPRGRSPFRQNTQSHNSRQISRAPFQGRPRSRSRSRSRSRTRQVPIIQSNANVDDRSFSEVMYSVSNNLGVTGRTLNDRFSY